MHVDIFLASIRKRKKEKGKNRDPEFASPCRLFIRACQLMRVGGGVFLLFSFFSYVVPPNRRPLG